MSDNQPTAIGENELRDRDQRLADLCSEWPTWLHEAVDEAMEVADVNDWSTEQVLGFAILLARRSSSDGLGTVSVKPMKWIGFTCPTQIGIYRVKKLSGNWVLTYENSFPGFYDSREEAFAAAQSDFETRVKSCLTSIGVEAGK